MKKWIILLIFFNTVAIANNFVSKVIPVKYVSAKSLINTLKPMLSGKETISSYDNKLVVNVSPETLTKIRPIIHELDKPKKVLIVTIHQGSENWLDSGYGNEKTYATSGVRNQKDNQAIQVQDGSVAFVSTGRNFPVVEQVGFNWFTPMVSYERMQTKKGFYIQPVLQGNRVKLTIKRRYSEQGQTNEQSINQSQFETTTTIPLNKWTKLSQTMGSTPGEEDEQYVFQAGGEYEYKGTLYIKINIDGKK